MSLALALVASIAAPADARAVSLDPSSVSALESLATGSGLILFWTIEGTIIGHVARAARRGRGFTPGWRVAELLWGVAEGVAAGLLLSSRDGPIVAVGGGLMALALFHSVHAVWSFAVSARTNVAVRAGPDGGMLALTGRF